MIPIENLVIGGGLAGTTIAVHLWRQGKEFLVLESSPRLGGKIETLLTPEACFEFGPNSFTNQTDDIFDLLEILGIKEDLLEPTSAARYRYILKKGKITRLPSGPPEILLTKALSLWGKIRFLKEIFHVPAKKKEEESIRDFFERHFGREVADSFADPFVSGIYAGDAASLSLPEAMPTLAEAEAKSSSLIRYLISQRKTAKAVPKSYELKRGLGSLFQRAEEKLGRERVHLGEQVQEIIPQGQAFRVLTDRCEYEAKNLYLTTPAYVSASLLKKSLPDASQALSQIDYAPVVTTHLRVPKKENYSFEGFGILLPSMEKRRILGVLWNSTVFPSLFGDKEHHYLTVYAGGARRRDLVGAEDSMIRNIISEEVQDLFSLSSPPSLLHMRRHTKAIPQYTLGYGKILKALQQALSQAPSLKIAGNYIGGISMPKTVTQAVATLSS